MPNLLLDTCVLLWLASGSRSLSKEARRRIDNSFVVYVSPISLWEIARKVQQGMLQLPLEPSEWFARVREQHNLTLLSLSEAVMFRSATLPEIHKDPADRFIIATALINNLVIVSSDHNFPKYGVTCII